MGFDIECIIDINSYPGEYFCPVCRTLVYPNEALQSQCTHLYCKPCLTHVATTTRACPYDGYLVTEADSKALSESDKVLAENVGKVKVRCLFHRSGCSWEGILSDSASHCASCTFGNSPVVCNRCGVQIVHRDVHDHALTCPGAYQAQQTALQDTTATSAISATSATATPIVTAGVEQNQGGVAQPAASQAQNPQITPAQILPGQDPNQQVTAISQAPVPAAVPTQEQWYQQYYQQYAGYDPYQQAYQQYYPYQAQQYNPPQGYAQPQAQAQPQLQAQPQPNVYPQAQVNVQTQPQVNAQVQVPVQVQPQPYQNVAHVNPTTQAQPYPMQTQPQQYVMPQYQMHPQQPQTQVQNYPQSYPPQMNQQPTIPNVQTPQTTQIVAPAVSGHQSYQPPHQIPVSGGPPQQHQMPMPMHNQISHQPSLMRPPVPSHGQVTTHQQQYYTNAPPLGPPIQQRPTTVQPTQQPVPPPQTFPVPNQGQYGHYAQQQSQLRPQGGAPPQQSQNYLARPVMPTHQSFPPPSNGYGVHQPFAAQNYPNRTGVTPAPPILNSSEKDASVNRADVIDPKAINPDTGMRDEKVANEESKDNVEVQKNGSGEPIVLQQTVKEGATEGSLNLPSEGKDMSTGINKDSQAAPASVDGSNMKDLHHSQLYGIDASSLSQSKQPLSGPPLRPQGSGYVPPSLRPKGPEHMSLGQPLNLMEHSQPSYLKHLPDAPFNRFPPPGSNFGPPRSFGQHNAPQRPSLPGSALETDLLQNQRHNRFDGHLSGPSVFGIREERFNPRAGEHANPIRPFDQGARPPYGPNYDGGSKLTPGVTGPPSRFMNPHTNPDFGNKREVPVSEYKGKVDFPKPDSGFNRQHMDHLAHRSPGREYFGMQPRAFDEGPRSFNLQPIDRFPPPGHHNGHMRSSSSFEQDILRRGDMLGPRNFPGQFRLGEQTAFPVRGRVEELAGGTTFPHHMPAGESFRGNQSNHPRPGEPGFRSAFPLPGFPNNGLYSGDMDPFDKTRTRKPMNIGWCRICKVDCESVEGLDIHSQTREHQRMAIEMVKIIKQRSRKKIKLSSDHVVMGEEANKLRGAGFDGRGNKS